MGGFWCFGNAKKRSEKQKNGMATLHNGNRHQTSSEVYGDRYLNEEAEKKAMAEKIERLELESEYKDKQITELQELYNSQQRLTSALREKLEKTEKKLEEIEPLISASVAQQEQQLKHWEEDMQ